MMIEYIRKQLEAEDLPCPDRYKVQMDLNGRSLSQWYADEMERLSKQDYQTLSNEERIRLHRQMRLFLGGYLFLYRPVKKLQPERSAIWQSLYYCDKIDHYYLYEYEVGFPADRLMDFRQVEVQVTCREEVIRHRDYEILEATNKEDEVAGKEA